MKAKISDAISGWSTTHATPEDRLLVTDPDVAIGQSQQEIPMAEDLAKFEGGQVGIGPDLGMVEGARRCRRCHKRYQRVCGGFSRRRDNSTPKRNEMITESSFCR